MKSRRKFSRNCSMNAKNCEMSGRYNFWTPVKIKIADAGNWNYSILFGLEIEVGGGMAPLPYALVTPLVMASWISFMEITCSSLHFYTHMICLFILSNIIDLKAKNKKWIYPNTISRISEHFQLTSAGWKLKNG